MRLLGFSDPYDCVCIGLIGRRNGWKYPTVSFLENLFASPPGSTSLAGSTQFQGMAFS